MRSGSSSSGPAVLHPMLVPADGMYKRLKPIAVNGAEPVNRDAQHALLLFALPGMRIWSQGHAEDPVSFLLLVAAHKTHLPHRGACDSPNI